MSLYGAKYFVSSASFQQWLRPDGVAPGSGKRDVVRRVRALIARLTDVSIVAIDKSVFLTELSDARIIEWGPQMQMLRDDLMSLPVIRVGTRPGEDWVELSGDFSKAIEFVTMAPTGNASWVADLIGLQRFSSDMQELCALSDHLDIYDRYLIQNLAAFEAPPSSWVETLQFLLRSASRRTDNQERLTVTLRGVIPAQQMRGAKEELLEWIDVSRREVRPSALTALKKRLLQCAEGIDRKPRILLDVREEPPRNSGQAAFSTEWFHGRFIHIPRIALISSDRSMDFVGRSIWGNAKSDAAFSLVSSHGIRDNGFIRWPQSQLSEVALQQRWSQQVTLQKGGPVELLA